MKRVAVTSSMIASIGYDADGAVLEIEFTTGDIYQYQGVPADVHAGLMQAESHGRYFNEHVREIFPHLKVRRPRPRF